MVWPSRLGRSCSAIRSSLGELHTRCERLNIDHPEDSFSSNKPVSVTRTADRSLFEAVADIVERIYSQTHKPVPFATIEAEIGRYRRIVKPASLLLAAIYNPRVAAVDGNRYVPVGSSGTDKGASKNLDAILRDFEKRIERQ